MNYFITGTDTGVGKTLISCALLHAFAAKGKRVAGMKPVAAGCEGEELNEDVKALRAATNILASLGQINPYSLPLAIAPHLAARHNGISISAERIVESYNELASQADVVIVEGAGGLLVPINDKQDMADLAALMGIPLIVVVGMRLGCLNHALLTMQAMASRKLRCAGWIANVLDADMPFLQENIAALQQRIAAPLLGVVQHQAHPDAQHVATQLDLTLLETPADINPQHT